MSALRGDFNVQCGNAGKIATRVSLTAVTVTTVVVLLASLLAQVL